MAKYRIDDSFEIIGAFWKYGEPDDKFTGTLTSREGRVEILTAPTYSELEGQRLHRALMDINSPPKSDPIPAICGFTTDGNCTLLRTVVLGGGGVTNLSGGYQIETKRYRASGTVMGLHLQSSEAPCFNSADIILTKIHNVMPSPWTLETTKSNSSHIVPSPPIEVFRFTSEELGAEIICEVSAEGSLRKGKGTRMKPVPRIRVTPISPQSAEWYTSIAFRLENFFTLLLGTSVGVKQIRVVQGDKDGWLVMRVKGRQEKVSFQSWVRCTFQVVSDALQKWLETPIERRPVERILLGIMRKSTVFDETEFLSLAQALEGFGRIKFSPVEGKEPTFAHLIKKTYELLSADFALQLLGEGSAFAKTVLDTRNYYTHLGSIKKRAVTEAGKELFLLNQRLRAFLRCVMLIDLGVAEINLKEPIMYESTKWSM